MIAATAPPLPPIDLMRRVVPLGANEDEARAEYDAKGKEIKELIVSQLPAGWSWEGKRVLDFGCGAGRILRHFSPEARVAEFWGSEIDNSSVEWIAEHLSPPIHPVHHGESPPLEAPSGHFHLIYAMSVFTHIADAWSAWLVELHRLLAPDGILIASFLGPGMIASLTGERWSDDRIGMNVTRYGTSWQKGGPNTFISPWWLRAHWGRAFDILRLEPASYDSGDPRGLQGLVVLRRKPAVVTRPGLEAPEPGEPRELTAARHNVRQLARELSSARKSLDGALDENRRLAAAMETAQRHWRETAEWWEQVAESVLDSRTWRARTAARRVGSYLRSRFGGRR